MIAEVDATKFKRAMESLSDALLSSDGDASMVLTDETKRLTRQIMNFTPPFKSSSMSEDVPNASAKKIGELAIQRDLRRLYSEADTELMDEVGSRYGVSNINTFVTGKDGAKLNLRWQRIDPEGSRMAAVHNDFMNSGRKLQRLNSNQHIWAARNVVPKGSIAKMQSDLVSRVGRWKASWAKTAMDLGDKMPSWISRHNVSNISVSDKTQLTDRTRPSITFGSKAPGVGSTRPAIQAALNQRAAIIVRRVAMMLRGYKKDIESSGRANSHGREGAL